MHNFTIKSIRSHFHKTVTSKAPCPCKHRFVSLPLQSTLQLLVVNITFHSLRLSYLAGPRLRGLVNHSHSFSLKIGNETIYFPGGPFWPGPLVVELRCPKLRYATGSNSCIIFITCTLILYLRLIDVLAILKTNVDRTIFHYNL